MEAKRLTTDAEVLGDLRDLLLGRRAGHAFQLSRSIRSLQPTTTIRTAYAEVPAPRIGDLS
jgi:hypothetical protein